MTLRPNDPLPLRVALAGAGGRMGREALKALAPPEFEIVAASARRDAGRNASEFGGPDLVLTGDLSLAPPYDVLVDLSHHSVAADHAESAMRQGAAVVVGCTGLTAESMARIEAAGAASGKAALIVPNFSLGAVLMMRFAQIAAEWMPDVEILELHHERKEDAPSGTAMLTARLIAEARGAPTPLPTPFLKAEGARGASVEGIPVHSVRLPGYLAHQAVMFGGPGESLTIRHDSMDRASFMPGVRLAARRVGGLTGVVVGLDKVLFKDQEA